MKSIDLSSNQITEINWDGCPSSLEEIDLSSNQITEINGDGAPENLKVIFLNDNQITEMNWEGIPENLKEIYLCFNRITKMNWGGIPRGLRKNLKVIGLWGNQINEDGVNWGGAPKNLEEIWFGGNQINEDGVNWEGCPWNLELYPRKYQKEFNKYKAIIRIQRLWLRKYTKRKYAAKVISEACHNWVWKPLCKDGTIGIRPRLDMEALGEYLTQSRVT